MSAYALALISETRMNAEVQEYLGRIDGTLLPYGGQFLIHGGPYHPLEGGWKRDVVLIGFPDLDHARRWYASAAYQAILPLRTENTSGDVILVEGVEAGHRAADIL